MAGFRTRTSDPVDLSVIPYPAVTLLIDLSDGLHAIDDSGNRRQQSDVVLGLAPGRVRGGGHDIETLQVRLSPVVAHAVLDGSAHLTGTTAALEDLWGPEAARIHERLRAAASWDDRFAIVAATLARRLATGRAVDPEVAFAWRQTVATCGQVRVEQLAADAGWSRKRLWSRFRSQIGMSPKRAGRLVRFDHAARRLVAGHSPALVAAESGYVDQSHLHRDVMTFADMTPTAVAVAPWLAVDDVAWAT